MSDEITGEVPTTKIIRRSVKVREGLRLVLANFGNTGLEGRQFNSNEVKRIEMARAWMEQMSKDPIVKVKGFNPLKEEANGEQQQDQTGGSPAAA